MPDAADTELPHAPAGRGRPRCTRRRAAVLGAAAELLAEGGLRAATIEAVSARSGVSKATIYKYWPNRTAVAIDAFAERMEEEVPPPDTGSARGDLVEQVLRVSAFYSSQAGVVYSQLLAQVVVDPEAGVMLRERFLARRREVIRMLWQRGLDRGEVRSEVDPEIAIDALFGPVIFRLVSGHRPLDRAEAEAIADAALNGLLSAGSRTA